MKYLNFVVFWIVSLSIGSTQSVVTEEPSVRDLMNKFERLAKETEEIDGWRIKIINTTDRRQMERARYKFNQLYPDKDSKSEYVNPYYSVRTGAYEKRIDLEAFLSELKEHFRNAIPIRDRIRKEEIVLVLTDAN